MEEKTKDRICELKCNIDDMTAEELSFAAERLMAEGAKDVTVTPMLMKKGRPAHLLTVMCAETEEEKERFAGLIFRYTTTIGIREVISERFILDREIRTVETPYGPVRCKHVSGYGVDRIKAEYDDIARIAAEKGIGVREVKDMIMPYLKGTIQEE